MPTAEDIKRFKKAFKVAAKAANKKIRWDEPEGCLSFFQSETSLSRIVTKLEDMQREPTERNLNLVKLAINQLPKDKKKKYATALNQLVQSLDDAFTEAEVDDEPVSDEDDVSDDISGGEDDEPTFDESVPPSISVIDTFINAIDNSGLAGWKKTQQKQLIHRLEDEHSTSMIFNKDPLKPDLEYMKGNVPTTLDDETCEGQSLDDFHPNEKALVQVGLGAIDKIRSKLTKGPFNNYLKLDKSITKSHKIPDELIEQKLLAECGSMSLPKLKEHAKQMFKVDGLTTVSVRQRIRELEEELEELDEDSEDYEDTEYDLRKLKAQLPKLEKIDTLTDVSDLGAWLKETPAPGWWNSVVDTAAGIAAKLAQEKYPEIPAKKIEMACLGRATLEIGGGVCSKMAMATHGELTTKLPPGSEIAQVFHNFDHEFVVARVPGGRWFVVDPWPHDPMVVPFVDSSFDPTGVTDFVISVVNETCEHPYGVDLDTDFDWPAIIEQAKEETSLGSVEMKGVYGHSSACEKDVDPRLKGTKRWG